ncbi:MAG: hypothetical protein M3N93_02870 [Acidobacteriota bacterium]|nr:hypothetical protein [Acidobacteriota bacterium]
MAHRSIEETFQAIKPRGSRGIPAAPTIGVGISSNGDLSSSLSQAGQQIAQLQSVYQQQAALIAANTQAIQGNTSAQTGHSTAGSVAGAASSFLGGGLGLLSPLISGIASLFGGSSRPAPLPVYVPPSPVSLNAALTANAGTLQTSASPAGSSSAGSSSQTAAAPHVTVNVSAMDSQSFMDRSSDIASAVREAMLNLHPINDVVANL